MDREKERLPEYVAVRAWGPTIKNELEHVAAPLVVLTVKSTQPGMVVALAVRVTDRVTEPPLGTGATLAV